MSQRLQIALPDPVATQLQELAASAGEPTATLAGQILRNGVALAARPARSEPPNHPQAVPGKRATAPDGLSPTAATPHGDGRYGARSWRCTAATPATSNISKTAGGPTRRRRRRSAPSPHGELRSTTTAETPERSSHSTSTWPTSPTLCASWAAASAGRGSPARRHLSGTEVCTSSPRPRSRITSASRGADQPARNS